MCTAERSNELYLYAAVDPSLLAKLHGSITIFNKIKSNMNALSNSP